MRWSASRWGSSASVARRAGRRGRCATGAMSHASVARRARRTTCRFASYGTASGAPPGARVDAAVRGARRPPRRAPRPGLRARSRERRRGVVVLGDARAFVPDRFAGHRGPLRRERVRRRAQELRYLGRRKLLQSQIRRSATARAGGPARGVLPRRDEPQPGPLADADLRLGHSSDPNATMYAFAPNGDTSKRILHADDVRGICDIYPKDGPTSVSPGVTPPGNAAPGGGCGSSGAPSWEALLVALGLLGNRRHLTRSGRPRAQEP